MANRKHNFPQGFPFKVTTEFASASHDCNLHVVCTCPQLANTYLLAISFNTENNTLVEPDVTANVTRRKWWNIEGSYKFPCSIHTQPQGQGDCVMRSKYWFTMPIW